MHRILSHRSVAGAKEAHAVSPHSAQIMYVAMDSALFSAPIHFTFAYAAAVLQSIWNHRPLSVALGCLAFAAGIQSVHFFSIAHPYLVAVNRHYTFYIRHRIINAHQLMQYDLLVPLYIYSWLSIVHILRKTRSRIWVLGYILACTAVLMPAPLIEFRYYTITGIDDTRKWLVLAILYVAIN